MEDYVNTGFGKDWALGGGTNLLAELQLAVEASELSPTSSSYK